MKLPSRYRKFSSVWKFINMDKHSQDGASFGHELVGWEILLFYWFYSLIWIRIKKSVASFHLPLSSQTINLLQMERPKRLFII